MHGYTQRLAELSSLIDKQASKLEDGGENKSKTSMTRKVLLLIQFEKVIY